MIYIDAYHDWQEFLSSVACQKVLDKAWKKGVNVHWIKMGLCILFPPLVWCLVEFEDFDCSYTRSSACNRLIQFFRAPVVKFASSMVRLMEFSVVLLYKYDRNYYL